MNDKNTKYQTCRDIRFRVIDGEGVIIRQEEGELLVVNEVGARILELLSEGIPTAGLIDRITQEFTVGGADLTQDVHRYLSELESARVVEKAVQTETGGD